MNICSTFKFGLSLVIYGSLIMFSLQAQDDCWPDTDPAINWSESNGTSTSEQVESLVEAPDGGYLLVGWETDLSSDPNKAPVIWKTNNVGELEWTIVLNEEEEINLETAKDVVRVADGYVIVGRVEDSFLENDGYILKIDFSGNIIWLEQLGEEDNDRFVSVTYVNDQYVAVGSKTIDNFNQGWIVVFEEDGTVFEEIFWNDELIDNVYFNGVEATLDGGIIIAGHTFTSGVFDGLALKFLQDGFGYYMEEWQQTLNDTSESDPTFILDVTVTTDDEYVFVGNNLMAGISAAYVTKLGTNGSVLWSNAYDLSSDSEELLSCIIDGCGNIIVSGWSFNEIDALVFCLTTDGELLWETNFGGSNDEYASDVILNTNGKIVLAGSSGSDDFDLSSNAGLADAWLWELVSNDIATCVNCEAFTDWNSLKDPDIVIELCPDESLFLTDFIETYNDTDCYAQTFLFAEAAAPNNILSINESSTFNANDYASGSYIAYALNYRINTLSTDTLTSVSQLDSSMFCYDLDGISINISSISEVDLSLSSISLCTTDDIVDLENIGVTANGIWTNEAGDIVNFFNPSLIDGNTVSEFYYTANTPACADVDTLSVMINEIPEMPTFGQTDYAFCSDEEMLMSAEGENVLWYNLSNLSDEPTSGNLFQPTESGVYYVTQTINACTSMPAAVSVLIENNQEVTVNGLGGPLCAGDTLDLNSLLINTPNDGYWTGEGVEDNQLITEKMNAGIYNLSYTIAANVCDDFSDEFEWELLAPLSLKNDAPQIECKDLSYQVNFTIDGGLAPYTVNGETIASNNYTSEWRYRLDYEYIIEDAKGCTYYIAGKNPCPGVFLHPNPNNGEFWVSYGELLTDDEEVIVTGYDAKGREIANKWITYSNEDYHFTLVGLPVGVYFFVFQFDNESITKKVVIFR